MTKSCKACPTRDPAAEPGLAEFLAGEMSRRVPSCRTCIDWLLDSMTTLDLPVVIVRQLAKPRGAAVSSSREA